MTYGLSQAACLEAKKNSSEFTLKRQVQCTVPLHYTTQYCSVDVSNDRFSEPVAGGEISGLQTHYDQSILL